MNHARAYRHREGAEGFDPEAQHGASRVAMRQAKIESVWSTFNDRKWYTFKRPLIETNKYRKVRRVTKSLWPNLTGALAKPCRKIRMVYGLFSRGMSRIQTQTTRLIISIANREEYKT